MQWLFDLGNTRLKWAVLEAGSLVERGAMAHSQAGFERELHACLEALPHPSRALLASVAGEDLAARVAAIAARSGVVCERVHTAAEAAGVRVAYADPSRLGVDRFLSLLGATRRGGGPWLVAGVGTALTIDLLASDGHHLGGMIAPSPTLMREALARRAPQLDVADGERRDFATDTADALVTGCDVAAVGMIIHAHVLASRRLGQPPALLLSGGGAPDLLQALPLPHEYVPDLVLDGLVALASE